MQLTKPELLAPAGNIEKLETAIRFGADAVYAGLKGASLRSISEFSIEDLKKAVKYVKSKKKKLYLAINIFAFDDDIKHLNEILPEINSIGPDALIVSDPGIIDAISVAGIKIPIHLSTQANTTNASSVRFWKGRGISRTGLARELSLLQIKEIRAAVQGIEIEVFVHGALCLSYSGRCYLSQYLNNRSANRGDCTQPCRWKYNLMEETRQGMYFPVGEDEKGTFIMNSKDLCLARKIPDLMKAGVDAFKIEGRNKTSYYLANVVRVYRDIIDRSFEEGENFSFRDEWMEELLKVSHRNYTEGFISGNESDYIFYDDRYVRKFLPVGKITGITKNGFKNSPEERFAKLEVRNKIEKGDELECISPGMKSVTFTVNNLYLENGSEVLKANNGMEILIPIPSKISAGDFLRKKELLN